MFFDDAVRVSKLLDLTLTGRDCGLEERAPMCGVPYHAAETYISKLVSLGEKVAICEQLSDPKEAGRGMVERDVIRVVSAGTLIEDGLLDERKNNYIACAVKRSGQYALAWADITTGEFCASCEEDKEALLSHLVNLSVAEIICTDELLLDVKESEEVERHLLPAFSCYLPWAFAAASAEKNLKEQLRAASLEALGLDAKPIAAIAAGALLEYLRETQKHALSNINRLTLSESAGLYDARSRRRPQFGDLKKTTPRASATARFYGSSIRTRTGMGARKLASMLITPLLDKEKIDRRLDAVEELASATVVRMGISDLLGGMRDIERLAGRISNGNLQPQDCISLSRSLAAIPSLKMQLTGFSSDLLRAIASDLADTREICALLDSAISETATTRKEGNFIRRGYNKTLDSLRDVRSESRTLIAELEARERERTGIRTLKVGFNRVFGYYIEVSNSFKEKVPYSYVRRQTLTNGERYTTEELKSSKARFWAATSAPAASKRSSSTKSCPSSPKISPSSSSSPPPLRSSTASSPSPSSQRRTSTAAPRSPKTARLRSRTAVIPSSKRSPKTALCPTTASWTAIRTAR